MAAGEWVIVAPGTPSERVVAVHGRLLVGRECAGVEPSRRLVIDDATISRDHFELRVEPGRSATLVDISTNGTYVNGRRVERAESIALTDGDRIELGAVTLAFRAPGLPAADRQIMDPTTRVLEASSFAIVVGDLIGYTTLTERHGGRAVAAATDVLFAALRELLVRCGGTMRNFMGDAFFASWDVARNPAAARDAVRFALAAHDLVLERAADLTLQDSAGQAVRMGWAVTIGDVAPGRPAPGHEAAHGDPVNLAFRLSGLAARDGVAPVLVTAEVATAAGDVAAYGAPIEMAVKGRSAAAVVLAAAPRKPA